MTDNEAIKIVDNAIKSRFLTGLHVGHEFAEALGLVVGLAIRASANDKLYNPKGDCISRDALKETIKPYKGKAISTPFILDIIDNAQIITLPNNQVAWEQGYECGYHQAKEDVIRRIKEQYNAHHELIPHWLSIGDTKGDAEE